VCSDIPVFKEVSQEALYFADPASVPSIAQALHEALVQEKDWRQKSQQYAAISRKFSWDTTAKTCLALMSKEGAKHNDRPDSRQKRVIWYADSEYSSVARDVAEMLYPLNQDAAFKAMRNVGYMHKRPSYLVEMGAAAHALGEGRLSQAAEQIYIVDDSR